MHLQPGSLWLFDRAKVVMSEVRGGGVRSSLLSYWTKYKLYAFHSTNSPLPSPLLTGTYLRATRYETRFTTNRKPIINFFLNQHERPWPQYPDHYLAEKREDRRDLKIDGVRIYGRSKWTASLLISLNWLSTFHVVLRMWDIYKYSTIYYYGRERRIMNMSKCGGSFWKAHWIECNASLCLKTLCHEILHLK